MSELTQLLIGEDVYKNANVNLGTNRKAKLMHRFIQGIQSDGVYLLNISKIDERIRLGARFLFQFEPEKVVCVGLRRNAHAPVLKFAAHTRYKAIIESFVAGTFTNPSLPTYIEPDAVLISDPLNEAQPVLEAAEMGIPVVAICDTDSPVEYVDLVIPANNRGRKSLALVYWLLAREILKLRGEIPLDTEWTVKPDEFEKM
ncbi:30S ribosomal protein S2 [Candidatus Marsarchaeota G1 archaeon BE_D]|uniref:Small ribosomal subunit protein uS2 n=2 Tax=Candidatus Marsarchaeota group 1 TaxID=2203770 RepID=A0A2R6AK70_9ARCH|nr:MAG: 30S ribosomal protein S2 [Candidatus Marsarchaeota G1 archaeon BE_D]